MSDSGKKYDVFISHASEDKDAIVRPLATILERLSVRVWYDEFSLQFGDSLTAAIDKGLRESKYGLVILSKSFLGKNWPDYEYRSLMTREIDGERVILPLWYGVNKEDIKSYSLFLADIKAISVSRDNLAKVLPVILNAVRPDIWKEMKMRGVLRKVVKEGTPKVVNRSEIKVATSKQSKMTKQQIVRSKAVYYGIGQYLKCSFDKYIDNYELDLIPERELQSWEIMNACYLEMLDRHPDSTNKDKMDYFRVIFALSLGSNTMLNVDIPNSAIEELSDLWLENYYDF